MATTELTETETRKLALHYPPTAGMLLVKIGRAAERWFTEALKPSGLTPRHVGVLFEVRARPTSQQALIDSIGVDPSKLVGLLNDLEAEGLIVRRRDPEDRRRHIVEVSKEGRTRLAAAEQAAGKVEERLFAGLDDAQRKELHGLLAQVADSSGVLEGCVEMLRLSD
ncbi:MAG TPA: MarR family transcriptional regulator [Gaiellaceae bacterium]|jgi:DNA-binding MarR family transcriptional regulator|nr:MarR family transcriptional regulator [Gaiellaceae bacterium]